MWRTRRSTSPTYECYYGTDLTRFSKSRLDEGWGVGELDVADPNGSGHPLIKGLA